MERIARIRQQERITQVVSGALISGVATLGAIAYFLGPLEYVGADG